ncbi:Beta-catenin-interacting protein 1 [Tupaia chinensis]|uniref:Beta-catenin-interacting protein 1 n=1 Tax=Tupaia chinensis TaxID=246437 RepID=L9L1N8_TUPCH|nr:Beta-catenin-interacting protein 1 [Tupaia chinensis]
MAALSVHKRDKVPRVAPSYFSPATAFPSQLSTCLPEVNFQKQVGSLLHLGTAAGLHSRLRVPPSDRSPQSWARGMNREGAPAKSPEEMYIQQKVRVLLMLRKMGSNLTASEEEFLRTYAGVVSSQLSQLPQHSIDQGQGQNGAAVWVSLFIKLGRSSALFLGMAYGAKCYSYLKPWAEEERRVAAEEKQQQDELKRIERELADA